MTKNHFDKSPVSRDQQCDVTLSSSFRVFPFIAMQNFFSHAYCNKSSLALRTTSNANPKAPSYILMNRNLRIIFPTTLRAGHTPTRLAANIISTITCSSCNEFDLWWNFKVLFDWLNHWCLWTQMWLRHIFKYEYKLRWAVRP